VVFPPAVVGGDVYVGSEDGSIYALDASTGTRLRSYPTGAAIANTSAAVANGIVYIVSNNGNLYAVDAASGTKVCSAAVGGISYSSPAVANGVVYVGTSTELRGCVQRCHRCLALVLPDEGPRRIVARGRQRVRVRRFGRWTRVRVPPPLTRARTVACSRSTR
jgi:glucose dehydrogenase